LRARRVLTGLLNKYGEKMKMYDTRQGKQEGTYQMTGRESETQEHEEEPDESILEVLAKFRADYEW
jgi:hypothetical protein